MLSNAESETASTGRPPEPAAIPSDDARRAVAGAVRSGRRYAQLRAIFEVLLCSDIPTQLLLMQLLAGLGLRPFTAGGRLSMTYVAVLSLGDAVLLISLMLWLLRRHGERPRELFLGSRALSGELRLGLLLVPGIILIVVGAFAGIQRFVPWLHNVPQNPLEALIQTPRDAWSFALVAIVAGGVREELQRAFILTRFEQHLGGGLTGLIVFSVAFGAGHIIQGWDAAAVTTVLGALWGLVYLRRRSVVAPMVSHAGFNLVEIVHQIVR